MLVQDQQAGGLFRAGLRTKFITAFALQTLIIAAGILVIHQWLVRRAMERQTVLQARAIENQAYVVGVNRIGSDPQFDYNGRSVIVDPHGEIFADAGDRECCLSAELDLASLLEYRRGLPFLADMRSDSAKRDA